MYCTLEIWNKWWNHWFHVSHEITGFTGFYFDYPNLENLIAKPYIRDHRYWSEQYLWSLIKPWSGIYYQIFQSWIIEVNSHSRSVLYGAFISSLVSRHFITGFITLGYSTLVQQIYWLLKILLVYTLQSTVLLECVQLKSRFITIKFYFSCTDLNRAPQK